MKNRTYRYTGVLYLLVIIFAGTAQGYIRATIVDFEDSSLTANQIITNEGLFRAGLTFDLIAFLLDAIISVLLYLIFKPVSRGLALTCSAMRIIAHPAIGSMNLLNHYLALHVLQQPLLTAALDPVQLDALSVLFMEAHRYGYLIAGGFFGIHCFLLGILIIRSKQIPKLFGGLLIGSAIGYLIETFININLPGYETYTAIIVGISAALGELSFAIYLIAKGRKSGRPDSSPGIVR